VTSNLIPCPLTAEGPSPWKSLPSAIENPKSKIQNHIAVVVVAASMLAAGCGLTKPSQSAAGPGKPAASAKSDGKTPKNDTIPNAAAVGL
jgi:hypothetical protein